MSAEPWTPHLAGAGPFDPASLLAGGTLPARWAARWAAEPDRPALHAGAPPDGSWWSAGRLDERTRMYAGHLARSGLRRGDRLVWSPEPTHGSLAACLGALRLGAVVVPVNPALTGPELARVVADVRPSLAVAGPEMAARLSSVPGAPRVHVTGGMLLLPGVRTLDRAAPGDPALIVYTSGTTGTPKGAVITHANLLAGAASLALAWRWVPDDRLVVALPLFHVHGLCAGVFTALAAGSPVMVLGRFSPEGVLDAAAEGTGTLFFGVPTMYHRLAASGRVAELARLRLCVSGSAPLSADLWHQVARASGVAVLERYGMTETLLTVSNPYAGERRPGTVGFPLPGVQTRLEDDEVATAVEGARRLWVRGPTVFDGYWERPAQSAEVFSDGWFSTGDLGQVDADGYLAIRGRRRDLIITGGLNVYPAEVEDVLAAHPSVAEAGVAGVASDEWGETVTAWVVPAEGGLDVAALVEFAAGRLAPYKLPRQVHVVDALPRNALGKLLRHELR